MNTTLQLELPPLRALALTTRVPFTLRNRHETTRRGELPLAQLAGAVPARRVEACLHPDDSVVASVTVPPLPAHRMAEAITNLIEPLALSDLSGLVLAHGAREPDGTMAVAWLERPLVEHALALFEQAGLPIEALLPAAQAQPSLRVEFPRGNTVWRRPLVWAAAAAAVWLLGLNVHAWQLSREADALRARMTLQVKTAFPDISVVLDPLRQATQRRDALRAAGGQFSPADFLPLTLAVSAKLPQAADNVAELHYTDGELRLRMTNNDEWLAKSAPNGETQVEPVKAADDKTPR